MVELNGKYAKAKIFTDLVDEKMLEQIKTMLNSPISEHQQIRIMPDCHAGAGCVIGTTMTIGDKLCPNVVGVDIGCGVLVVELGKINLDMELIDEAAHSVPSGTEVWSDKENKPAGLWADFLGIEPDGFLKNLICIDSLNDKTRIKESLGSLGGGNHFIEFDKDDEDNIYLVIHSGSRILGKKVADYYQTLAYNDLNNFKGEQDELIKRLKEEGRSKEIQEALIELKAREPKYPRDTAYLEGDHLKNYLHDMELCQKFASASRRIMATEIIKALTKKSYENNGAILGKDFPYFETIHNYINFNDYILRKGAVSAREGEKLIIPMNMRDGSLICLGKGNPDWNYSAPHGAGRLMSRGQAKHNISLEEYKKSMEGIYSTTVNIDTIDESPMAYKPMQSIIENVKDSVDILKIIKPIYNFKASE